MLTEGTKGRREGDSQINILCHKSYYLKVPTLGVKILEKHLCMTPKSIHQTLTISRIFFKSLFFWPNIGRFHISTVYVNICVEYP